MENLKFVYITVCKFLPKDHKLVGKKFPGGLVSKVSACKVGDIREAVRSLGQGDPLKEGMAAPSSILAWGIPWTEKPVRLQPTGSQRVGHDWSDWVHRHVFLDDWPVYYHKMLFFIPVTFFTLNSSMFEINIAIPALFLLMVYGIFFCTVYF